MLFDYLRRNLLWALCLPFLLSACGPEPEPTEMKSVAITVPGTPWYEAWEITADRLQQRNSDLKPVFYITGQLGSEETSLSQLRRGRVQVGGYSLQGASSIVPELGVLLAPFLFNSEQELDFVLDNYINPAFAPLFAEKGVVLMGWAEVGWTYIYGKQPILTPQDAAGLKLRSSNAVSSQLLIESVGANMVPLPFPDIMPSLQTGLISGGESGSLFYALAGIPKEAPHLTLTRHAFDTGMYLANRDWYLGLNEKQQQDLAFSLPRLEELRVMVRSDEKELLANPEQRGIQLHALSEQQLQAWREATFPNHQKLVDKLGGRSEQIYQVIQQGKAEFARRQAERETTQTQ